MERNRKTDRRNEATRGALGNKSKVLVLIQTYMKEVQMCFQMVTLFPQDQEFGILCFTSELAVAVIQGTMLTGVQAVPLWRI